jgi:hypothetical protein
LQRLFMADACHLNFGMINVYVNSELHNWHIGAI